MGTLKLAFRTLFKTPFVTLVAIISLALGIGSNAAIFSLFEQMLLRPLPVHEPRQLVNLSAPGPKHGSTSCSQAGSCELVFSYPMFRDLEAKQSVFTGIAAHRVFGANLAYRKQTLNGEGMLVSGSYFPVLGIQPAIGRLLGPADDQTIGAHFVAVLSHDYWQSRLGGDRGILNQTIVVNGQQMTVVGVTPPGFEGTTLGARPHVFVPISMRGLMSPGFDDFANRRSYWAYAFARLKPGVTIDKARLGLNAVYKPIVNDVEAPLQKGMSEQTLVLFRKKPLLVEEGQRGQSSVHEEASTPLKLLFGITGIVLLIACANIANLLLTRATARRKEIAIRTALGASRFRLICQMLTESILLALLGGGGGLLLAVWCTDLLTGVVSSTLPRAKEVAIDGQTLLFTLLVALLTGLLFGLAPAIQASKTNLNSTLKEGGRSQSSSLHRGRLSSLLVVTQIALSLVLLVSAGLFIKSFRQLRNVNPGFDPAGVATMHISLPRTGYAESRQKAVFFQQVLDRVATLPGVQSAGVVTNLPLGNSLTSSSFEIEGRPPPAPDESRTANKSIISHDYFRAMGIPLLKGRALSERDATDAPGVVVINQAMARRFFSDEDPLGKRLTSGGPEEKALYGEAVTREIVGIVGDVRFELEETAKPEMYIPYTQAPIATMALVARSGADPASLREPLRRAIQEVDRTQTGYSFKTMGQLLSESVAARQLVMMLTNIFAALALILAAVGIYGVIAYSVAQRTHELGIRIALGAQTADVLRLVVGQGMTLAILGVAVGLASAFVVTRFLSSLLYGVSATDAPVFIGTAALLGAVALLASYIPARRATKVDPLVALRHE